jgi:hypothetical protein
MKFKLRNLGKTETSGPIAVEAKAVTRTYYPSISLSASQIPTIGECKLGEKYRLVAEVEIKSIQKGEDSGSDKGSRVEVELKKAALLPMGKGGSYESAAHEAGEEM